MAQREGDPVALASSEKLIQEYDRRIEALKIKYTLFFNGEEKLPPERERQDLEKSIRLLLGSETKSARARMLVQNLTAKFSLFNNLWLKKLNEREFGVQPKAPRGAGAETEPARKAEPPAVKAEKISRETVVNLSDEDSFDAFFRLYRELLPAIAEREGENVVNAMKSKLISHNLVSARLSLTLQNGKLNIKIRPQDR